MDYYGDSASWPTQAQAHFVRYRKVGNAWNVAGPFLATRASVIATAAFAQATGITIDADSRLVFDAGVDIKAPDILLWIERNDLSTVVEAHDEPTYVECFVKASNKNTSAPAPWA